MKKHFLLIGLFSALFACSDGGEKGFVEPQSFKKTEEAPRKVKEDISKEEAYKKAYEALASRFKDMHYIVEARMREMRDFIYKGYDLLSGSGPGTFREEIDDVIFFNKGLEETLGELKQEIRKLEEKHPEGCKHACNRLRKFKDQLESHVLFVREQVLLGAQYHIFFYISVQSDYGNKDKLIAFWEEIRKEVPENFKRPVQSSPDQLSVESVPPFSIKIPGSVFHGKEKGLIYLEIDFSGTFSYHYKGKNNPKKFDEEKDFLDEKRASVETVVEVPMDMSVTDHLDWLLDSVR